MRVWPYINITSNSTYCRLYRYNEIKYIYDSDELKNFNKEKLTIVLLQMKKTMVQTFFFQNFQKIIKYLAQFLKSPIIK